MIKIIWRPRVGGIGVNPVHLLIFGVVEAPPLIFFYKIRFENMGWEIPYVIARSYYYNEDNRIKVIILNRIFKSLPSNKSNTLDC